MFNDWIIWGVVIIALGIIVIVVRASQKPTHSCYKKIKHVHIKSIKIGNVKKL
jgi:hypothetical protein